MSGHDDEVSLSAATFADGEAAPASTARSGELAPGTRLGPYIIRRLLGAGGMGAVYLAEQTAPVHREVALKLIRGEVSSPLAQAYFEVERQALAQMQHPAIAQIFDAGSSDDQRAWLAMEWVEGVPITRFCEAEHLATEDRLALFERVCHGVQHAHQKGVIHRDLKPDNVLVRRIDGVPQPKIIDFGVAIGETAGRGPGARSRAGTAAYMSPEQASPEHLDLDTRSDVYSLGVMLFELLTGIGPSSLSAAGSHTDATVHATLMAADGQAATSAAGSAELQQAARNLPGELRAVLRKALAPQRGDRYASASALADDLRRYAQHQPLHARPATRGYIARKFISRHRLGLGVATLTAAALIVGIVVAVIGLQRAETARANAQSVANFMGDMLESTGPDIARGMDTELMRKMLDDAAQRVPIELADQPAARATIEHVIGNSYNSLGKYRQALMQYQLAASAGQQAKWPADKRAWLLAAVANTFASLSHHDAASTVGHYAMTMVADVPDDDPDKVDIRQHMAYIELDSGHLEAAQQLFESLVARHRKDAEDDPDRHLSSLRGLAQTVMMAGDGARADRLYQRLIARDSSAYGKDSPQTLADAVQLSVVYLKDKQFAKAEHWLRPLLPRVRAVYGPSHPITLNAIVNLGGAIRQQGRNEEARPYYETFLAASRKRYGDNGRRTVMAEANLAFLLRDTGELAQAEKNARFAIAHMDAAYGADNGFRGAYADLLGTILMREKRYGDAEQAFKQAWALYTAGSGYGPHHPMAQDTAHHIVTLYKTWGKADLARKWQARIDPAPQSVTATR